MHLPLYLIVMLWLSALAPNGRWVSRYWEISSAIASASEEEPLFAGDLGPLRTAAYLTAVAYYESTFSPTARGPAGELGLFQIHPLHKLNPEVLKDPYRAAPIAREMMRTSMRECSSLAQDERLALYASGDCRAGRTQSAHRVRLARWLAGETVDVER